MIRVLSLKIFTGKPFDAVETTMAQVFGRFSADEFDCAVPSRVDIAPRGALHGHGAAPRIIEVIAGKYDILFGVGRPSELLFALLRPKKTKYILHYQSILLKKSEPHWNVRMPWPLRKFIFSQADMVIAPSAFSAGTISQFFPNLRVEYVLNGIDPDFFRPDKGNIQYLEEKFGIDGAKPLIAFVGALQQRKRPDVFINIARKFPEANFVAVGRPLPEHDFLTGTEAIKNFKSIPLMSREDVAIFLASSRCFVFPSLREPAALVNLEAMASGAVPLLSKSGGNVEFLTDGVSGFLIPNSAAEEKQFIAILKKILSDALFYASLSKAARAEAERHTWNKAAGQYRELFVSLAEKTGGAYNM